MATGSTVDGSHYHCCICPAIYKRPNSIRYHLITHEESPLPSGPVSEGESVGNTPSESCDDGGTGQNEVTCGSCAKAFSSKKSLQNHTRYIHTAPDFISGSRHLNGICVDPDKGIYLMRRSFSGTSHPVHVIHSFGTDGGFVCELNDCRELSNTARRSGNPSFICNHLKSVQYVAEKAKSRYVLSPQSLEDLTEKKMRWFKKTRKQECSHLQTMAANDKSPLIAEFDDSKCMTSVRYKHFSVYDGEIHHYSRFKRVVVSYDETSNKWSCACCRAKVNCVHKSIARWYVYEVRPADLFKNVCATSDSEQESENDEVSDEISQYSETSSDASSKSKAAKYPPKQKSQLSKMVEYIHKCKRIPLNLPRILTHDTQSYPNTLVPKEEKCHYCKDVSLSEPMPITRRGKIFTPTKGITGELMSFIFTSIDKASM